MSSAKELQALSAAMTQILAKELIAEHTKIADSQPMLLTFLPNELWRMAWCHLPLRDRLTVTWVCRAWRSIAISTASMWTSLDFDLEDSTIDRSRWEARVTSLIKFIPTLYGRGKAAPLSISVADMTKRFPHSEMDDYAAIFAKEIQKHQVGRLRNLHLSFSTATNVRNFLSNIDRFTELVTLTAHCEDSHDLDVLRMNWFDEDDEEDDQFGAFITPPSTSSRLKSFPNLRQLLLNPRALGFVTRPRSQETVVSFPCLEEIRLGVTQASDFAFVLESCPQLSIAHLNLKPYSTIPSNPSMPANYAALGSRLRSLVLDAIPPEFEGERLADEQAIYLRASLHNLRLNYQLASIPDLGLSIFGHLDITLSVVITVSPWKVTVTAQEHRLENRHSDTAQKTREISFTPDPTGDFWRNAALWTHLSPSLVAEIEFNLPAEKHFAAYLCPIALPSARRVKVIFGPAGDTPKGRRSLLDTNWSEILPGTMVDFVVQSPGLDLTFDSVKALVSYLET